MKHLPLPLLINLKSLKNGDIKVKTKNNVNEWNVQIVLVIQMSKAFRQKSIIP